MRSRPPQPRQLEQPGLAQQHPRSASTTGQEAGPRPRGTAAEGNAFVKTVRRIAFKSIPFVTGVSLPSLGFGRADVARVFTASRPKRKLSEAVLQDSRQDAAQPDPEGEAPSPKGVKRAKTSAAAAAAAAAADPSSPRTRRNNPPAGTRINSAPTRRLDIVVFGTGEEGELGLGSIRYEGRNPAVADKPRLNHLLRAEHVGVVQVAVGGRHCVALTHDGHVLTWGSNDSRALGRDTAWERAEDARAQDAVGLNPLESTPLPAEGLSHMGLTIAQVAATDNATFALTDSGLVYGWGTFHANDGVYGFLREKMQTRKPPNHCFDSRFQLSPVRIDGLRHVKALAAGMNHVLALTTAGDVYAWGSGQQGQLGRRLVQRHQYESLTPRMVDLPRRGIVRIYAGFNHSFALDRHGQVWTWGLNNFGQTGIPAGPAGHEDLHVGSPAVVPGLAGHSIRHLAPGFHHSLACTEDGQVLAWGRCDGGQSGMETRALPGDRFLFDSRGERRILLTPTVIPALTATFVAAGPDTSLSIDPNGTVSTWGFSEDFRTGLGAQTTAATPAELVGKGVVNRRFVYAACGAQFAVLARPA
ncbi:hypothetical protein E4U41_007263 [Claviceps citrina]|nr:hypothetical protein E4U41_007263 [Claviceps citrina]